MTQEDKSPFWSPKRILLIELFIFFVVLLVLQIGFIDNLYVSAVLTIVLTFGYGVGMLAWSKVDAGERGYHLHPRFPLAVVVFGTLAFIYYLFRSHGFVSGLTAMGYFILFAVSVFITSFILGIIVLVTKLLVFGIE